jgi:hypothetical protein
MGLDTRNPPEGADPRRAQDWKRSGRANNSRRRRKKANAYDAGVVFNYREVYVTNLDGERIGVDDWESYFKWFDARPDDWPVVHLTATGIIDVAPGTRPSGRENPEPRRMGRPIPYCLPPALIRCAVVLQVEDRAWDPFSAQLRLRRLPHGVQWLWDRRGRRQAWFQWPRGWTRDGEGALPAGVRLIDDQIEAPLEAHLIAKDFWMQRLPPLPPWLVHMAGGRPAKTTAECIVNDSPLTREIAVWPEETEFGWEIVRDWNL